MSGTHKGYEPPIYDAAGNAPEIIRNLLTVVGNPDNNPGSIKSARRALENWRGHEAVDEYFVREAERIKAEKLTARILALKDKPIKPEGKCLEPTETSKIINRPSWKL